MRRGPCRATGVVREFLWELSDVKKVIHPAARGGYVRTLQTAAPPLQLRSAAVLIDHGETKIRAMLLVCPAIPGLFEGGLVTPRNKYNGDGCFGASKLICVTPATVPGAAPA